MPSATFVLVHGGFHGGWCWSRVASRLRQQGHTVLTPTQTGLGERAHLLGPQVSIETFIADIVGVLEAEEITDAVLVGHSFGGISVTGAADRVPERISQLVLLDAILVEDGRCAFDDMPAETVAARIEQAENHNGVKCLGRFGPAAFGVSEPEDAAWLERRLTPHPLRTYTDVVSLDQPLGNGLPCTYIACNQPFYPPLAASRDLARNRKDWRWRELCCGHDAMVLDPDAVSEALLSLLE